MATPGVGYSLLGYCPDCDELAVWFLEEPNLLHFNIHPKKLVTIEIEWV